MGFGPVVSCGGNRHQIVGRGPVPRRAWVEENAFGDRAIARDRPSRYGPRGRNLHPHRRAGACPPPCLGESKTLFMTYDREGQALALRAARRYLRSREQKTAPPYRRAGACPPPCLGESNALHDPRSRGTGPRATVTGGVHGGSNDREGQALALRERARFD